MIDAKTKLVALIGNPVEHSLSPIMHNAVFKKFGMNYVYLAFKVDKEKLKDVVNCFKALEINFNVTIPHKIEIMKYLDDISKEAKLIQAVNVVKIDNGKAIGYNTDGIGALKALKIDVKDKNVLILGAGGAARAIAFQLALNRANVYISNRTFEKALKLSDEIRKKTGTKSFAIPLDRKILREKIKEMDIVIQATSVGMYPNTNETLLYREDFRKDLIVMDIVYNPLETRFLKEAKKAGAKTIDGLGMLIYQGIESLKIWFEIMNEEEMENIMRKVLMEHLSFNRSSV